MRDQQEPLKEPQRFCRTFGGSIEPPPLSSYRLKTLPIEISQCRRCNERLPGSRKCFWVTSGNLSLRTAASICTLGCSQRSTLPQPSARAWTQVLSRLSESTKTPDATCEDSCRCIFKRRTYAPLPWCMNAVPFFSKSLHFKFKNHSFM